MVRMRVSFSKSSFSLFSLLFTLLIFQHGLIGFAITTNSIINVPINVNIYLVSNIQSNNEDVKFTANDKLNLLEGLSNTFSRYRPSNGYSNINFHLKYNILEIGNENEFITKYGTIIRNQPIQNENGIDYHACQAEIVDNLLNDNQSEHFQMKSSFSSFSIVVIPPTMNSLFRRHLLIHPDGSKLAPYEPYSYQRVLFLDLASFNNQQSRFISKFSTSLSILAGITTSIRLHLVTEEKISDVILSASNLFFPIILLHRLNTSSSSLSSSSSMPLAVDKLKDNYGINTDSKSHSNTVVPNIPILTSTIQSLLMTTSIQSISISAANYFIDEHPQLSVALSSSLRLNETKIGSSSHSSSFGKMYVDSRILLNEIKEIGDDFCEKLMDKSGSLSEIVFHMSLDRDNILKHKEVMKKIKSKEKEKIKPMFTSQKISKKPMKDDLKKVSIPIKKEMSSLDTLSLLYREEDLRLVRRNYAIVPIFVSIDVQTFYDSTTKDVFFESGYPVTSSIDNIVLILYSTSRQLSKSNPSLDSLITAGISQAITGFSKQSSIKSFRHIPFTSDDTAIQWKAKRSGLLQRAARLTEVITLTKDELEEHIIDSLEKLKVIPSQINYSKVNFSEILSLPQSIEVFDHYMKISNHLRELTNHLNEIQDAFLQIMISDEDVSKIDDMLTMKAKSFDEVIFKTRELVDIWDELLVDAKVIHKYIGLTELAADINSKKTDKNNKNDNYNSSSNSKSFYRSIFKYIIIIVIMVVIGIGMTIFHKQFSERVKKMK